MGLLRVLIFYARVQQEARFLQTVLLLRASLNFEENKVGWATELKWSTGLLLVLDSMLPHSLWTDCHTLCAYASIDWPHLAYISTRLVPRTTPPSRPQLAFTCHATSCNVVLPKHQAQIYLLHQLKNLTIAALEDKQTHKCYQ